MCSFLAKMSQVQQQLVVKFKRISLHNKWYSGACFIYSTNTTRYAMLTWLRYVWIAISRRKLKFNPFPQLHRLGWSIIVMTLAISLSCSPLTSSPTKTSLSTQHTPQMYFHNSSLCEGYSVLALFIPDYRQIVPTTQMHTPPMYKYTD